MKNDRYRNWCFTSYKPIGDINCKYMVYQTEICPTTNREHYQGYVEFTDKYSMKKVKEIFGDSTLHLEVRKGSQKQAIAYCTKKETRKEGTEPVIKGKCKDQGHRTDLDEIFDDIEEGHTAKEILIRHRGNALRHINCIKKGLMIMHDLDCVDTYILHKRECEENNVDLDKMPEAVIAQQEKLEARANSMSFDNDLSGYFDGQ